MAEREGSLLAAAVAISVGALVLAGCGSAKLLGQARAPTTSHVTSTIVIDPHVGEKFGPPIATASPALSARQAWDKFMGAITGKRDSRIPADVSVRLGLLTLPVGPTGPEGAEEYTARNRLVYGFSWHSCPESMNPRHPKLPANPCIEWNFLDANTGHQIDMTWQQ